MSKMRKGPQGKVLEKMRKLWEKVCRLAGKKTAEKKGVTPYHGRAKLVEKYFKEIEVPS